MSTLAGALAAAADTLDDRADELTRLDALQGDGDLGRTARLIAVALRRVVAEPSDDVPALLRAAGALVASTAPSSSGTLVASGFLSAARALASADAPDGDALVTGLAAGVEGIQHRGKAHPGDRTLLDALCPAVASLAADPTDRAAAAAAAEQGVEATRTMQAKVGRARFLAARATGEPDPGAAMVGAALAAALRAP